MIKFDTLPLRGRHPMGCRKTQPWELRLGYCGYF